VKTIGWAAIRVVAAGLLLALGFGLGNSFSARRSGTEFPSSAGLQLHGDPTSLAISEDNPEFWLQVTQAVNRVSVADGRVVAVVGVEREDSKTEFLPVIHSQSLAQQVLSLPRPQIPRDFLDEVHRAGWTFESARQFLSLQLPDGQNQLMPVDTLNYRYVGHPTF
jgi:hypothetical protein